MKGNSSIIRSVSLENASVSQCLVPPPHNFDFSKPELWPLWQLRFKRYLTAANLSTKNESEKVDTLCYVMGEKSETVLAQVMPNTEGKTLTEVLQAFTEYFCPNKNVVLERYRFNTRIQEPDESVDQFVTALYTLAEFCQFGTMRDELIRDRIVVGLLDTNTSEQLQLKSYLTLEEAVTIAHREALYQEVQEVMDNLTPENFNASVNYLRVLHIDSEEQLQGVVDRVYEKAVSDLSLMPLYARMCKELAMMRIRNPNSEEGREEKPMNFKKLIITRCQIEFERNFEEVKAFADPIKKEKMQLANIGFLGELFKQGMLRVLIMDWCIRYFLQRINDESLECLCKLLCAIGKELESKGHNLDLYFKQMLDIVSGRVQSEVSPNVRFMLQDLIELKMNKWVPREDNGSP